MESARDRPAAPSIQVLLPGGWPRPRGYADVGVGEISRQAGLTSGAIYHHFSSKPQLFRAVYEELVASTAARIAVELR